MENSSSKLTSSGETHTTALTFMVLFTALVLVVALGGVSSDSQTNANQPASDVSTSATANSHTNTPTNTPTEINMPDGIPVDEEAVVENRMISRGADEPMQQVITFDSSLTAGDLVAQYQTWLAENNYTIEEERVSQKAASLAATNGDNALIVLISYLSNSGISRVEIINYRR